MMSLVKASHTQGGAGEGVPKEREVEKRREVCEGGVSVCVWRDRGAVDVKVDTKGRGLHTVSICGLHTLSQIAIHCVQLCIVTTHHQIASQPSLLYGS